MPLRMRTEMPELKGITEWVNGEAKKEDFQDKPVLVHFWSISCGMCKKSLPDVNEIRDKYPELEVVGIHMPRSEKDLEIEPVKEVITQYELTHPQGIDNEHNVVDAFENEFVPAFYLFDKEGLMRHRTAGEKALGTLNRALDRVLNEEQ